MLFVPVLFSAFIYPALTLPFSNNGLAAHENNININFGNNPGYRRSPYLPMRPLGADLSPKKSIDQLTRK